MVHDAVLSVRVPTDILAELDAVASRRRITHPRQAHSRNSVVREALVEWLDRGATAQATSVNRIRTRPVAAR